MRNDSSVYASDLTILPQSCRLTLNCTNHVAPPYELARVLHITRVHSRLATHWIGIIPVIRARPVGGEQFRIGREKQTRVKCLELFLSWSHENQLIRRVELIMAR